MKPIYVLVILLALLCAWGILAWAEPITQADLERHKDAPPRVIQILQHFGTTEEVRQFINDRREVRELIKPDYRKDKVMHSLWRGERYNLNIYADILEKRK